MKRILVIGTSGCGKSALAARLSKRLKLLFHASDHFYWESGWRSASSEKVRRQVCDVVHQESWILDGNFDDQRELVWNRADCIIWLDYPLITIMRQIIFRNLRWSITRNPTWSGNQMTLPRALSGIRHALRSYPLKKQNYPNWLSQLSGIPCFQFHSSREVEEWLKTLNQK